MEVNYINIIGQNLEVKPHSATRGALSGRVVRELLELFYFRRTRKSKYLGQLISVIPSKEKISPNSTSTLDLGPKRNSFYERFRSHNEGG